MSYGTAGLWISILRLRVHAPRSFPSSLTIPLPAWWRIVDDPPHGFQKRYVCLTFIPSRSVPPALLFRSVLLLSRWGIPRSHASIENDLNSVSTSRLWRPFRAPKRRTYTNVTSAFYFLPSSSRVILPQFMSKLRTAELKVSFSAKPPLSSDYLSEFPSMSGSGRFCCAFYVVSLSTAATVRALDPSVL